MGAPKGNKFAANALEAKRALEHALCVRDGDEPGERIARFMTLVDIWDKQIAKALEGDNHSATMIIDRLDGKPKQQVDANLAVTEMTHEEWLSSLDE